MKVITNKETNIKNGDKMLTRGDLLMIVVNEPDPKGIKISEMRDRMRILDKLDNNSTDTEFKAEISLEDADFTLLKKLFDNYGWLQTHPDILDLADHLDELSKTK